MAWKGYGREEHTWVPDYDVHADDLVAEFYRKNPGAPRRIRALRWLRLFSKKPRADTRSWRGGDVRGQAIPTLPTHSDTPGTTSDSIPTPPTCRTDGHLIARVRLPCRSVAR